MSLSDKLKNDIVLDLLKKKKANTKHLLTYNEYTGIYHKTKKFLENLSFENNTSITEKQILNSNTENKKLIRIFLKQIYKEFGKGSVKIYYKVATDKSCKVKYKSNRKIDRIRCIRKILYDKYTFLYKSLQTKYAKQIVDESKYFICPYCNVNYVNAVQKKRSPKSLKPDLDHFYPKSIYPFLAISLSNLFPSCIACNERLKGSIDFYTKKSIYPPENFFSKIEFESDNVQNKILIKNYKELKAEKKYETHLETFMIEEIYSSHTEILQTIKNKKQKYKNARIEEIAKMTKGLTPSMTRNLVFHEYIHMDCKNEPLYKLKKDLYEEE